MLNRGGAAMRTPGVGRMSAALFQTFSAVLRSRLPRRRAGSYPSGMPYLIALADDGPLDARIDLVGRSVILHSRGGSTGGRPARNEGYAPALIALCRRSRARPGALERVLIDSTVARRLPESQRVLLYRAEIETLDGDALARAVRVRLRRFGQSEGTIGGNSTKQVRFDFSVAPASIVSLLDLRASETASHARDPNPLIGRLSAGQLRQVGPLHVRGAVDRLLAGEDAPNFSASRDYHVVASTGERLAPKKVFGLAIEQALGIEAFPGHFSAGWGQPCFEIIQQAGFAIVDKAELTDGSGHRPAPPPDQEELSWAEGNPRLAEHLRTERRRSRRAVAAKRAEVRALNQGKLLCENPACTADWYSVFPLAMAEAVFEVHHTVPVSTMGQDHRTSLEDLMCLCAACHRAEHRRLALEVAGRIGAEGGS